MKGREAGYYEKRREANRAVAYFVVVHLGRQWTSIREYLPVVANMLDVPLGRRSETVLKCMDALAERGVVPPSDFIAPWHRDFRRSPPPNGPRRASKALDFYNSWEWRKLRYDILVERGRRCECCGAGAPAAVIMVDHIKPIRRFWGLRLERDNLQVLCEDCNRGKGSRDQTDFRKREGQSNVAA